MWLARLKRRIKGHVFTFYYYLRNIILTLNFKYRMARLGLSNEYVWEAFAYLASLDMEDVMQTTLPNGDVIELFGRGMFLEMNRNGHKYTMQQVDRSLYAMEWDTERVSKVILEGSLTTITHWHEVYRSNRHITDPTFILLLRDLYGNGPDTAVRSHSN